MREGIPVSGGEEPLDLVGDAPGLRGGDGALLVDENSVVHPASAVSGKLVNSVGCGDSMVAGFIAGYIFYSDYSEALKLSVACSAATAFSKELAKADEINNYIIGLT